MGKKKFLILLFLLGLFFSGTSQKIQLSEYYSGIFFGSGFGQDKIADSVNLQINDVNIFINKKLYSIRNLGFAHGPIRIVRIKNDLAVMLVDDNDETIYLGRVSKTNKLKIDITVRNKEYHFIMDLNQGKFILFDIRSDELSYTQHTSSPHFD